MFYLWVGVGFALVGLWLRLRYLRRPEVKLARQIRASSRDLKETAAEIKRHQKKAVYQRSEAYATELRTKGWYEDEGDYGEQVHPENETKLREHQEWEISWTERQIVELRTKLQGERETLLALLKQQEENAQPANKTELQKQLAVNAQQTEELQAKLKRLGKERDAIELGLAALEDKSSYREAQQLRFKTRVSEQIGEIEDLFEEAEDKKRMSA